jgi:hypothetical protein
MLKPRHECLSQTRIHGNWLLGGFRLTRTDDLHDDRSNHAYLTSLKPDISPFQSEEFAHAQAGASIEKHQRTFLERKSCNQSVDFVGSQYHGDLLALRALPHQANGIHAAEVMTDRVIE